VISHAEVSAGGARVLRELASSMTLLSMRMDGQSCRGANGEGGGGHAELLKCVRMVGAGEDGEGGGWGGDLPVEKVMGVRLAALVGRSGLGHAAHLLVSCAAVALYVLHEKAEGGRGGAEVGGGQGEQRQGDTIDGGGLEGGAGYFCRMFCLLLDALGISDARERGPCHAEEGRQEGLVLKNRGEEMTALALLVLIDALVPSLALSLAGSGAAGGERGAAGASMIVSARGGMERLTNAVEAVANARKPDGARFLAHVRVGASVRSQILSLMRD